MRIHDSSNKKFGTLIYFLSCRLAIPICAVNANGNEEFCI